MTSTAMALAVSAANKSAHDKWRLGSVVWRGGSVLSTGVNRGAKLFVARVTRGGNLALAKPCSRCMDTIMEHGIKKVYYTDETGEWTFFRVWS